MELGQAIPVPDPGASDPDMDVEEPIYLHLRASTEISVEPAGVVAP